MFRVTTQRIVQYLENMRAFKVLFGGYFKMADSFLSLQTVNFVVHVFLVCGLFLDPGRPRIHFIVLISPNNTILNESASVSTSGEHSSAFSCSTTERFLWCLHSLELTEFSRRLETNSKLGFSDLIFWPQVCFFGNCIC